ncbi:MAG: NAD(P)H-hydrate dehydratase, partial [Myxococcota bacterium]
VVAASGHLPSLNPTGSPTLSTGGSGDVLTGLIGALLARGAPPRDAARLAAFVHGRAGELLAARRRDGWTASDVAAAIPDAAAELTTA